MEFTWYFFGLLTAVLGAAAAIVMKRTLVKEHALEFAATIALVNAAISAPFLLSIDYAAIPLHAYSLIILAAMLDAIAYLFVVKATRHMPVSLASPLLVLAPAVTALLAFFILGETLTPISILGLFLVLFGVYILEHQRGISLKKNLRLLSKQRYVRYIFAALFLYGSTNVAGRYLLGPEGIGLGIPPMHVLAMVHVLIALFFYMLLWLFFDGRQGIIHGIKQAGMPILLIGLLTVSYRYTQSVAFGMAEGKVGLVEALKRTSALIVTAVGGSLFHEKELPQRIFATFIIIGGVLLIII